MRRLAVATVTLLAVALVAGRPSGAQLQHQTLLPLVPRDPMSAIVSDDFSDPGSAWPAGTNRYSARSCEGGLYRVRAVAGGRAAVTIAGPRVGDVSLQADAWGGGGRGVAFGLVLAASDDGASMYVFLLNAGNSAAILKRVGGAWTNLTGWVYSPRATAQTPGNRLQFVRSGTRLSGFVNGECPVAVDDADLGDGRTGMIASTGFGLADGVDAWFDDLVVAAGPAFNLPWAPVSALPDGRASTVVAALGRLYAFAPPAINPDRDASLNEYDPAAGAWRSRRTDPVYRRSAPGVVAAANGRIYVIGGLDRAGRRIAALSEYDPVLDTWTRRSDMPAAKDMVGWVAAGNGKLYAIGGSSDRDLYGDRQVLEYDPTTDAWTERASMPEARVQSVVAEVGGRVYVVGGGYVGATASVFEYDTRTDRWRSRAPIPAYPPSVGAAAVGPNAHVYVLGTGPASQLGSDAVWEYDPLGDTWARLAGPSKVLVGMTMLDRRLYALGGYDFDRARYFGTVEEAPLPRDVSPAIRRPADAIGLDIEWLDSNAGGLPPPVG